MLEKSNGAIKGIDTGTNNVKVAVHNEALHKGQLLMNREGYSYTPSVVIFDENGNVIDVGRSAKENLALKPGVTSPKSSLGKKEAITKEGVKFSPRQCISSIVKQVVEEVEAVMDPMGTINSEAVKIKKVVLPYPAYFSLDQKEDLKQAVEEARKGMEVVAMIPEPGAAAIAFVEYLEEKDQMIRICDVGAGTTDYAMVKVSDNKRKIEILAYHGGLVGGDDIDSLFVEEYKKQCAKEGIIFTDRDIEDLQRLRLKAEESKIRMSSPAIDQDSFVFFSNKYAKYVNLKINRQMYNEICEKVCLKIEQLAVEFQAECREKGMEHVDTTLLIGGTNQIPYIREKMEKSLFNDSKVKPFKESDAVVLGAAEYGYMLEQGKTLQICENNCPGPKVQMTNEETLGIEVSRGKSGEENYIVNMVYKDMQLPVSVQRKFYTKYDNQKFARIAVYSSKMDKKECPLKEAVYVGETRLEIKGNLPKDSEILVHMEITETGLLKVRAYEKTGKTEVEVSFKTKSMLENKTA